MLYKEVFPHSETRPKFQIDTVPKLQALSNALRINLSNSTWLALGATLQTLIVLLPLPKIYTVAPSILYLVSRIVLTFLVTYNVLYNPYLRGVIPYRYTAIVPDKYGNFPADSDLPTKEKIAVLILCARTNHPGGFASPHTAGFGKLFRKMNDDLKELPQAESGFLGHTQSTIMTPDGNSEVLAISYWRSKEHILKYADSPAHREAMKWWVDLGGYDVNGSKIPHIGIGHEIYESQPGNWESVYIGMQPTLLGATAYLKTGDKLAGGNIPEEWISPVIEARRGKLSGSRGRMGQPLREKQGDTPQM